MGLATLKAEIKTSAVGGHPFMIRDTSEQDQARQPAPLGRRVVKTGIAAVLALALMVWLSSKAVHLMAAEKSVSVSRLTIATVERGPFVRDIAAEGRVVAAVSPTLYATHDGQVNLKVHAGDGVKKGQLLVEVSSPDLEAALAQAQSNAQSLRSDVLRAQVEADAQRAAAQSSYESAVIDAKTAQNDLGRYNLAFEGGASSHMQVDHAKDKLEKALIVLKHAKAGLGLREDSLKLDVQTKRLNHERQLLVVKDLQRQLADLQVRSPVDGQVGQVMVSEHASVAKDAKLLSVVDLSALEVQVQVNESLARDLAIGMRGEISGNGQTWIGVVSAVAPEVLNGEVAARLRFDGTIAEQLRQNQRLSVRVQLDKRADVLWVANSRFVDDSAGQYAYVVHGDLAVKTPIKIGARSIDKVEIVKGLKAGDRIVGSGAEAFAGAAQVSLGR